MLDIHLGDANGTDLIARLKERRPTIIIVTLTGDTSVKTAIEALRLGAYDYLQKPFRRDELSATLDRCFDKLRLEQGMCATERALAESELRFRDFALSSTDFLWETDTSHRFSYFSPGHSRQRCEAARRGPGTDA